MGSLRDHSGGLTDLGAGPRGRFIPPLPKIAWGPALIRMGIGNRLINMVPVLPFD
jgi:hypothetical protein